MSECLLETREDCGSTQAAKAVGAYGERNGVNYIGCGDLNKDTSESERG